MKLSKCFFIIPLILAGCNDKVYDVSYYSEHLDEATKVVEQCATGKVTDDNCKNAADAIQKVKRKKIISDLHRH
ncbi:TPA: EexN family lipoprotein [Escherichia coli]|nr:EexN family lipoprotein [Citrobacter freundii]